MRRLLAAPAALGLALALVLGGPPAGPSPRAAAAADGGIVVLLDGLCSTLEAGQTVPGSFAGDGGLYDRLRAAGWAAESIVAYSYAGGSVAADGRWLPLPYGCAESRDQGIARDAELLDAQLDAIAVAHPDAVFHLVGFSLGGLVSYAELARLSNLDSWSIPNGGRLGSISTLDSPLGGVPFVDQVCTFAPDECGGSPAPAPNSSLRDLGTIWDTGTGHPAGATRTVAVVIPALVAAARVRPELVPRRNQELALGAAADHAVRVLTIGNVRDWLFAPFGPAEGPYSFLDTQWLMSGPAGSGVYARAIDSGPSACPAAQGDLAASYGCNHALVTRDPAVGQAVLDVIAGGTPSLAASCPAATGGCLALPHRPAVALSSAVASGVVKTGGRFGTASVAVARGGHATLLFTTRPSLPRARIEIWARSSGGTYRFVTSRIADASGVVRYFTPPVLAWTAYEAKYPGDFVRGPGVSPGRVVTVR